MYDIAYTIDMPRRWRSFDIVTTNRELASLPTRDFLSLTDAMRSYRLELEGGFIVKSYGQGLMMIKATNQTQGRCLFFSIAAGSDGAEVLIALLFYKKETQEVPISVLETARQRMLKSK